MTQTHAPTLAPVDDQRILQLAHDTLEIEANAVRDLRDRLSPSFVLAVRAVLKVSGRVVVMGMGKSGHVGRKITATLASTGTPAMFVHPAEASHGDLGMVKDGDLVIAISNSGESDELAAILPVLKRLGLDRLIEQAGGLRNAAEIPEAIRDMNARLGLPKGLADLGVTLPAGTAITLPDITPQAERAAVRLWD